MRSKKILENYQNAALITKIHLFLRWRTCPFEKIIKHIPFAQSILDVGCGHGLWGHLLRENLIGESIVIHGFDIDRTKIQIARQSSKGKIGFYEHWEELQPSYDLVTIVDVLYLLNDDEKKTLIKKIDEKINCNGFILIKEVVRDKKVKYLSSYLQEILAVKFFRFTKGDNVHLPRIEDLRQAVGNPGMKLCKEGYLDHFYPHAHYYFLFQKS